MCGSVHVTGTTDPHHWDQFTALRACLGPVALFMRTAADVHHLGRHRCPALLVAARQQTAAPRGVGGRDPGGEDTQGRGGQDTVAAADGRLDQLSLR